MRATVTLCASLAILLAACSGNREGDNAGGSGGAPEDRFTVRAGPVSNAQLASLEGTFQMLRSGAPDAIPSSGTGGACLVFAAADLGYPRMAAKQCTTNQQCYTGEGERAAYCASDNTCWARPRLDVYGQFTCNRPITMTPAALNPVPRQPVDAGVLEVKAGAKVRVVACLNKGAPPWPNNKAPCAHRDHAGRIEVLGPVATVR